MGILWKVVSFPVLGPIRGVMWIAEQVLDQAQSEFYDEDEIRGEMVDLEMRYEAGEISEEQYDAAEAELLERLRASAPGKRAAGERES
jgi:uncharacterized membrane protein